MIITRTKKQAREDMPDLVPQIKPVPINMNI